MERGTVVTLIFRGHGPAAVAKVMMKNFNKGVYCVCSGCI